MAYPHRGSTRFVWDAVLVIVVLLGWESVGATPAHAQVIAPELRQQVERDVRGADRHEKNGPLVRVGTQLARIYREHERHQRQKAGQPFRPNRYARSVVDDHVAIDAIAVGSVHTLQAELERLGLRQGATAGNLVSGYLPIEAIPEAAQLDALRMASVAVAVVREGVVTTQGDAAMRADEAREATGMAGNGVTVGVLSDSYDTNPTAATSADDDIASGDLPPLDRITILQEASDGSDEGRAMMQIIHDVAPGADLAFHTAFGGQANFVQGIRSLAAPGVGASVMVDDIFYLTEPMFQDGIIAQAIDEVVDAGVAYFSAAGNNGRESYSSTFRVSGQPGPGGGRLHDFGGGDAHQRMIIPEGDSIRISFQWTDPYASAGGTGADSDVDLYLLDGNGDVVARSDFNNIDSDPIEFLEYKNEGDVDADNDGAPDQVFDLVIELFSGPPPEAVKYVYFPGDANPEDGEPVRIDEYDTESATIFGHSNAAGAGTVGAVFWFATPAFEDEYTNPFAVNDFSSVGGVPIYFRDDGAPLAAPEVREKPDFTGPDGGNTTFFGQELNDDDNFPNFFGTSAAAPHVAGVAALMRAFDPARSPLQIYDDLERTALDMTAYLEGGATVPIPNGEGFDFFSGYGLVQADAAVPNVAEVTAFEAARLDGAGRIRVTWTETDNAAIDGYVLERQYFKDAFEAVAQVPSKGPGEHTYTSDELGLGLYTYRLRVVRDGSPDEVLPLRKQVTIGLHSFEAELVDEDENVVRLTWSVPEATSDYRYVVQKRSDLGFARVDTTSAQSYTMSDLQPGVYDFRLEMVDEAGNAFAGEAVSVQVPFEGAIALGRPYPNPFVDRVHFPVTIESDEFVTVRVYSALGRIVHLFGQQLDANIPSTITIESDEAWASGVYFIQIVGDTFTENGQAVLVR